VGEITWVCELRVYNNHNREDTSTRAKTDDPRAERRARRATMRRERAVRSFRQYKYASSGAWSMYNAHALC